MNLVSNSPRNPKYFNDYLAKKIMDDWRLGIEVPQSIDFDGIKLTRQDKLLHRATDPATGIQYGCWFNQDPFNRTIEKSLGDMLLSLASKEDYKTHSIISDIDLINASDFRIKHSIALFAKELGGDLEEVEDFKKLMKRRLVKRRMLLQEALALHASAIKDNKMQRCTSLAVTQRKIKNAAADAWAKNTLITNREGTFSFSVADAGVTRYKKLSETYAITKGIEVLGEEAGWSWASVVCTAEPSKHPNPRYGTNSWDGSLPNETAREMQHKWALVRAALAKKGITLSGLWTREAHMDGCPHLNFMIYFHAKNKTEVQDQFIRHFSHTESKNGEERTDIRWQDGSKEHGGASFATYAFKYFSKHIDGGEGQSYESIAEEAWASAYSLRRYGFFGIPSISQWRRLRAQRKSPDTSPLLQELWAAAKNNNADIWISSSGGLGMKNKLRPIKTVTEISESGKSRIATGVEDINTGDRIISKRIGEWTLDTLKNSAKYAKKLRNDNLVTLVLSYPSEKLNVIVESTLNPFLPMFRGDPYPRK